MGGGGGGWGWGGGWGGGVGWWGGGAGLDGVRNVGSCSHPKTKPRILHSTRYATIVTDLDEINGYLLNAFSSGFQVSSWLGIEAKKMSRAQ